MSAAGDIFRGLKVGWRFLLFDRRAAHMVDDSPRGVWRSFWGPALAFPIFVVGFAMTPLSGPVTSGLLHYVIIFVLGYVMTRLIWPVVITLIAPLHGKQDSMLRYMAAYNWSVPFQMGILFLSGILVAVSRVDPGAAQLIRVCGYGMVLIYHMVIVRSVWGLRGRRSFMLPLSEFFIVQFVFGITWTRMNPGQSILHGE